MLFRDDAYSARWPSLDNPFLEPRAGVRVLMVNGPRLANRVLKMTLELRVVGLGVPYRHGASSQSPTAISHVVLHLGGPVAYVLALTHANFEGGVGRSLLDLLERGRVVKVMFRAAQSLWFLCDWCSTVVTRHPHPRSVFCLSLAWRHLLVGTDPSLQILVTLFGSSDYDVGMAIDAAERSTAVEKEACCVLRYIGCFTQMQNRLRNSMTQLRSRGSPCVGCTSTRWTTLLIMYGALGAWIMGRAGCGTIAIATPKRTVGTAGVGSVLLSSPMNRIPS